MGASAQQIILDGKTNTTLNAINPTTTTITTTTISGGNGINSFKRFGVDVGNTVNLIQPSGTQSLINIITGTEVTNISGILNAYKDGRIGGNSIIANTNGIAISKSGLVNAGRLTLTTPSREFTDSFFNSDGSINAVALNTLNVGGEQLNPNSDIDVHGKIDAEAVAIRAGRDIKVDGVIHSRFGNMTYAVDKPNSAGKKSAKVQAATGLSVSSNGVVRLFAGRNAKVGGSIKAKRVRKNVAPSTNNVSGGEVYLYAEQDLTLDQQALIDVSGTGSGDAGTALLFAGSDAVLSKGALITANAEQGNAGFVEFSASKSVNLAGDLSAYSQSGANGTIFIDPEDLTISKDYFSNGANLLFIADKTITVDDGITLNTNGGNLTLAIGTGLEVIGASFDEDESTGNSTQRNATLKRDANGNIIRTGDGVSITLGEDTVLSSRELSGTDFASESSQGNSGDITLYGPEIAVKSGAEIYAHATGSFQGGKISLTALREQLRAYNTTDTANAFVHIDSATLKAREIDISAEAFATNLSKRRDLSGVKFFPVPEGFPPSFPTPPSVPELPTPPDVPEIPGLAFDDFGPKFKAEARSEVVINSSSLTTDATGGDSKDINIRSNAGTDIVINPDFKLIGGLTFQELAGLSLGVSETHSKVAIKDSTLASASSINIGSHANETQELTTSIKQNDGADAVALNLSLRDLTNQILLHPDTRLSASNDISINAVSTKDIQLSSIAEVQPHSSNSKLTALASNLSIGNNITEVVVAADLNAAGNVNIAAKTIYNNYVGQTSALIANVASRQNGSNTQDSDVLAAQAGIRKYVGEIALRLFDIDLNENRLLSKAVVKGVEKGIQNFSFAGALDISEEQDETTARVGIQYTDLDDVTRPTTTLSGPINPVIITAANIDVKSLMSYGEVDVNDDPKGVIIAGQAIRKRSEAGYKYSGGAANQQDARLLDGSISTFSGQTQTDIAGNAILRSTNDININAKVQYPSFNSAEFKGDIEEYLKDALPTPNPVDGGFTVQEPTLLANPLEDYFTTFARAKGSTAKSGYALNGTYFAAFNDVSSTVRSGADLRASGDVNIAAIHKQQTLHVTNLPFSTGSSETGIGGSFSFNRLTSSASTTIENGAIVVANNIHASALNTGTTFNNSYSHGQSTKTSINGALAFSNVDNDTIVDIGETAKLTATDKIVIDAKDDLNIWTIGGGIGRSQKTGVGIALGQNEINRTTIAAIGNRDGAQSLLGTAGTTYLSSRLLDINAQNSGKTIVGAAGWGSAGTGGAGIAGSIANNDYGTVEAVVNIRSLGKFDIGLGGVDIDALTDIQTRTMAGAIGINGTSTLAGAIANLDAVKFDTRVSIDNATIVSASGINIDTVHNAKVFQIAGGGSIKGDYTGAGSLVISEVNGTISTDVTNASLTAGPSVTHNISINAIDNSEIKGAAGALTYAKKFGFGTSIVHNTIAMITRAASNNTNMSSQGIFNVSAKNTADIGANAVTAALSQGSTGSGSITINNIGNGIKAAVLNGSINALGGVTISADKETTIKSKSGAVTIAKNTAVGAAAAVNAIYDDISADLVTSDLSTSGALVVNATNRADISTVAVSGTLGANGAAASIAYSRIGQLYEPTVVGGRIDQNGTAENSNDVSDKALQLAESAYNQARDSAVNLRFNVGLVSPTPTDGTAAGLILQNNGAASGILNADSISVKATDLSTIESLSGGIGLASKLGGGAAFSINNYGGVTTSYLHNQGTNAINLSGGLAILAEGNANINSKAAALAGAGNTGIAGSASVNLLNGTAIADIKGIAGSSASKLTISGGTVQLSANQTGTFESHAGAVGAAGKAGIAGAVAINFMSNDAIADIADTTLDTDGDIDVDAKVNSGIDTQAVSAGGAGTGSFAASVAVNTFNSTILAQTSGAELISDGGIAFDAENKTSLDVITGAAAVAGTAALGASISVNDIAGSVQALSTNTSFTADSVSFDAYSDADMSAKAAAGTFASTLAINAAFSRNDLKTEVRSSSTGGSINATGDVNFTTQNLGSNDALLVSVAAAKGALGASVAIAKNEAVLFAGMNGTNITNSANVTAKSTDRSIINTEGYGVGAGGLGASGVIIEAENAAQITAIIDGASNITSTGNLTVDATADSTIETDQIAIVAGFAGAGAAVSKAENDTKVKAHIRGTGNINASNVSVNASDKASIISDGYAIAATGTGGAGTDISAKNSADVDSTIGFGRGLNLSGDVNVTASSDSNVNATQASVAISGSVGAGIALTKAENKTKTNANIGATTIFANNISVAARDIADIDASGFALAAGTIGAGAAADILALNNASVSSGVGPNSRMNAAGELSVTSNSTGTSDANTGQISVGAVALGLSRAIAQSNNLISTSVGDDAVINAGGNISIGTKMTATNVANSYAVAGGLVGVGGAFAEALDDYQVTTNIGNSDINSSAGSVIIDANATTTTRATASGFTAGLIAGGTTKAFAGQKTANTISQTTIGGGANIHAFEVMSLAGNTTKTQTANVTSGGGGAGSTVSGQAETKARSTSGVIFNNSTVSDQTKLLSDALTITSKQRVFHTAQVNNVNASLVGYAGGRTINDTVGTSQIVVGENAQIAAGTIDIKAKNDVRQDDVGKNVISRSGGAFNGAAADASTTITNNTNITVKDGVIIEQFGQLDDPSYFNLGIENNIFGRASVNLDSGGAIAIARSAVNFNAIQNNQIEIGAAKLFSAGDLNIYNRSDANIIVQARSTTYGASGSAQASSVANFTSIDNITFKAGADVVGTESVNIMVGSAPSGDAGITVAADTRLFNRTFIPVNTNPTANSTVNAARTIDIQQNARIRSAKDVNIYANKASNSVSGFGLGKDLWQEIFEELFGGILDLFFDIDLSLEIRAGSARDVSRSDLNIDGTVLAGSRAKQYLIIDHNGVVTGQGNDRNKVATDEGITFTTRVVPLASQVQARIDQLNDDISHIDAFIAANPTDSSRDLERAATVAERNKRQDDLNALIASGNPNGTYLDLGKIQVDEGDIIINAANITAGSTGKLQANGETLVEINIADNLFINTDDIIFGRREAGKVRVNNVSISGATQLDNLSLTTVASGFEVKATSGNSTSNLYINSSYFPVPPAPPAPPVTPPPGPDIILNGTIDNFRGEVRVRTEAGTVDSRAQITALSFISESPNGGFIQSYRPGFFEQSNPQAQFANVISTSNINRTTLGSPNGATTVGDFNLLANGGILSDPLGTNLDRLNLDYETSSNPTELGAKGFVSPDEDSELGNRGFITAGKDVFIASEYINVNGLIQSGGGVYDLDISNTVTSANLKGFADANFLQSQDVVTVYSTNPSGHKISGITGNVIVFYDRNSDRLIANPLETRAGRIDLIGNIISTGRGEIRAFDGFGQVNVTNASDVDLALQNITTGAGEFGVEGVINITDSSRPRVNIGVKTARGDFLTTTYRYQNGRTEISDNNAANDTIWIVDSNVSEYQTTLNRQYVQEYSRNVTLTGTIEHLVTTLGIPNILRNDTRMSATGFTTSGAAYVDNGFQNTKYKAVSQGLGAAIEMVELAGTGLISGFSVENIKSDQPYVKTTKGPDISVYTGKFDTTQTIQNRIKADYAIKTNFFGATTPGVTINSTGKGRVLLNGSVVNSGPTNINAKGSIQTLSDRVRVNSGIANIHSQLGSISGQGNAAFNFELNDGATLNMTAGENINIHQFASNFNTDGNIEIAKIHHTGDLSAVSSTTSGNVTIRAEGDINGVGAEPIHVQGINVSLYSDDGEINAGADPLRIATGQGTNARFNASATGDINLTQATGNLKVDLIESRTGNVDLGLPNGQVLDANVREIADTQTIAALTKIWEDLGLLDDGSGNVEKRLIEERNTQYARYWNDRRDGGPIDFALTAQERAEFYTTGERQQLLDQGLSNAQIESRIDAYISETQGLYDIWNDQGSYDKTYSYSLRADEFKNSSAEWQLNQLQYGIPNTLETDSTDTTTAIEDPNIKAQGDITISQSRGIGSFTSDLKIETGSGGLFVGPNAQDVYLSLLTAEEGDTRREGDFLYIRRADDLDVTASGNINLNATRQGGLDGDILLGSEANLNLARLNADGEIRVTTTGDILDTAPDDNGTLNAGGTILLEAAKGTIGKINRFVRTNTPDLVTARAGKDIFIVENGDLDVGRINAGNHVSLKSDTGGIFDGFDDADANIRGISFDLSAANDIGSAANPLEIKQDAGDGVFRLQAKNAYIGSDTDLKVERLDVGNGVVELKLKDGSLVFAPLNGEAGLTADKATIDIAGKGTITDDENDTLAIEARDLTIVAGGVGEVNTMGVENRLNVNIDQGTLSASEADAIFRLEETDDVTLGTAGLPDIREIHVGTGNDLTIIEMNASDLVNLDKIGGRILSGKIRANAVKINSVGSVGTVTPLDITTNNLDVSARSLNTDIVDLDPATPLHLALRGAGGGLADRIDVRVTTTGTTNINELRVVHGDISTSGSQLTLVNATILENVWFRQQETDLYVTNKAKFAGLSSVADVQAITEEDGSVVFDLRKQTELTYSPDVLHHRMPVLTLDSVGDFSITAYEVISTRSGENQLSGSTTTISILDADGAIIGSFIIRFSLGPDDEIDPKEFILSEKFQSYVKENFGGSATVKINFVANQKQEISLAN